MTVRTIRLVGWVVVLAGPSGAASLGEILGGSLHPPNSGGSHLLLLPLCLYLRGSGSRCGLEPLPAAASVAVPRFRCGAQAGLLRLVGVVGQRSGQLQRPARELFCKVQERAD